MARYNEGPRPSVTSEVCGWLVIRHGANAANQPDRAALPVGIVWYTTRHRAAAVANYQVACYANQRIELVKYEDAKPEEWEEVIERDAELRAHDLPGLVWSAG
jgi:hypothetical protein